MLLEGEPWEEHKTMFSNEEAANREVDRMFSEKKTVAQAVVVRAGPHKEFVVYFRKLVRPWQRPRNWFIKKTKSDSQQETE